MLAQLRSQDDGERNAAAAQIWERYCRLLLDQACRSLDQRLRRRVGPEDIVQSTFRSFFLCQQRDAFTLADRTDLLRLLMRMTLYKARSAATRESRRKRNYRQEQEPPGGASPPQEEAWWLEQMAQKAPTPDEATALIEEAERRLAQLPDDLQRVALRKLEGCTNEEIAALPEMNCTVRTVERKLKLIREAWGDGRE